jgi:hypothetical protein
MLDPIQEEYISLGAVARLCARDGRPLSPVTVWRWVTAGRGPNKTRLEVVRVGGRTCTTRQALKRFLQALNQEHHGGSQPSQPAGGGAHA